ncbi:PAXNEB protein [Necator americanus]|uniref:Elongator complex protein 4 n=1 Tax=Necator americanus TaxID=51031 RepID=W2T232_NECAM|nr:PAXNEB protein [Necator americanus]ETN76065.1 PAXNEB protein [Necator americanus]
MNMGDVVRLKGCTLKGRSLETSCGCSALDTLLGGGLAVSTFCVVDELESRAYSNSLARYFIAEGLYSGHDVLVVDPIGEDYLWDGIPTKIESGTTQSSSLPPPPPPAQKSPNTPDDLRIAFRYAAKPQVNSSIGDKNRYDLGKPLARNEFSSQRLPYDGGHSYESLYYCIANLCRSDRHSKTRGSTKNLLRIVVGHLGSPIWNDSSNLSTFLARLRPLLRNAHVVLFATAASETMYKQFADELFATADLYLQLVAISEDEQKKLSSLEKYHGYLRILKLPRLTSVGTHNPPVDLVFTQKRNTFDVSILHLPPAFSDGAENSKTPCGIDF